MPKTKIEWADESWNPLRAYDPHTGKTGWHCVKIAPECANCYAATFNMRRLPGGGTGLDYVATSKAVTYLDGTVLQEPLTWTRPRVAFPCSMTDWAGEFVDPRFSAALLAMASLNTRHTFLFLTKRPQRMHQLFHHEPWQDACAEYCRSLRLQWWTRPVPNVWLGFSAGNQKRYDQGLPYMSALAGEGWNTWCSCEPMLDAVNFRLPTDGKAIRWVVFGGESGAKARPFRLDYLRDGMTQCEQADVPAFLKQLGRHPAGPWGTIPAPLGSEARWFLKAAKGNDSGEFPADLQGRRVFPFSLSA